MAASWRSESVPEREQFASWREACCQHVYAITPEREEQRGFRGALRARRLAGLDVVELQCEGHRVLRRKEDIARAESDTYYLYWQIGEAAWFLQEGRHVLAVRGDLLLADPNLPFSTGASGDFDFRIWRLPRRSLDRYLARPGRLPMIHLRRGTPECALVASCLGALDGDAERIDPRIAEPVADHLVRLVATAAGIAPELRESGREALRSATLRRVMDHAVANLADPALSPGSIAGRLGMSVRKLHMLFEPIGMSFGEWLHERRIAEARSLLANPAMAERSVVEIALAVGYNDLSTFYRVFRAEAGVTPGEYRAGSR
ncbi:MAG: helix-turn-helix domain-containing protein [Burkholderiales bacterium]|nr:helix-turn-helix domain-containing protein [Burkholderiales bacterium]